MAHNKLHMCVAKGIGVIAWCYHNRHRYKSLPHNPSLTFYSHIPKLTLA